MPMIQVRKLVFDKLFAEKPDKMSWSDYLLLIFTERKQFRTDYEVEFLRHRQYREENP